MPKTLVMRLFFLLMAVVAALSVRAQQPEPARFLGLTPPLAPALEPWPVMRFSRLMTPPADAGPPSRAVLQPLPRAWRFEDLALFCKIENRSDRFFPLPLRIRAGDVPYVDWLEGKRRNPY